MVVCVCRERVGLGVVFKARRGHPKVIKSRSEATSFIRETKVAAGAAAVAWPAALIYQQKQPRTSCKNLPLSRFIYFFFFSFLVTSCGACFGFCNGPPPPVWDSAISPTGISFCFTILIIICSSFTGAHSTISAFLITFSAAAAAAAGSAAAAAARGCGCCVVSFSFSPSRPWFRKSFSMALGIFAMCVRSLSLLLAGRQNAFFRVIHDFIFIYTLLLLLLLDVWRWRRRRYAGGDCCCHNDYAKAVRAEKSVFLFLIWFFFVVGRLGCLLQSPRWNRSCETGTYIYFLN